ncbi:UDP-N-acetylmuramoyl-tripeptide--D-alanyl-D-alanine ligase [Salegentibacter salegens]|uniref:UDP-N-acetylmuramoyl-tripeptide--D-alanyl-D-alanine ligase n=1 Tax=Salegentibacter salegens TaxID=143223 RepID=A0A1M7HS65_9FLAO|nr:UDP-N-acetylmuramoyl-tripeptide--D-alanyl-D-alanine ligase [Salegentibacter salegens]PRX43185.1 UDP-N-acetylmuramoyl-tripeptide--D-alanyl-D-alanine ligase [Salegentibacter salegens]SHM31325.1 UDP-N-acetylmuramoyl-tripeptide--D-alanyl-D-alanine ligase [Salegentibacter salegens]
MKTALIHQRFLVSTGISTDTRNIEPGSIFFALKGANFNGNEFAAQAIAKGAICAIVDNKEAALNNKEYIVVKNTLEALQSLAKFHRKFLAIPIIGITGSNGKTTTKELIYNVLSKKYAVTATQGNLNNHIGVPLSLLAMDEETEIGLIEMGANHPGEIEFLSKIAMPDYGLITNFGKAHLEGFGSLDGVIQAKTELYRHLKDNKKLIFLNLDDVIQRLEINYKHNFSFGSNRKAQVKVDYPEASDSAELIFNDTKFTSQLSGTYNAKNMAAALCVGLYFKVPFNEIKEAIESYKPSNNRSQLIERDSNKIYLDAYNANPTSMMAALQHFNDSKTNTTKIVILGDMGELGAASETEHQVVVNFLENADISEIYLVGKQFKKTTTNRPNIIKFENTENIKKHLHLAELKNCSILIKGSRAMALEEILEVFEPKV